jgi:serine/threonine-protein kinase RsbT
LKNDLHIKIRSGADIVAARLQGRQLAGDAGFSSTDQTIIATAISELARNIVEYAHGGEIRLTLFRAANTRGIRVEAHDDGPGIANIELAMQEGYSTGGGLGLGLPGIRRLMDEFVINSKPGEGTTVSTTRWIR